LLSGLPQYNEKQYSQGKRCTTTQDTHSALENDPKYNFFEPGGATRKTEIEIETEWFSPTIESAMPAIAEDKPQAADAINGPEAEQ
jgi:hypothetical protein